MSELLFFSNGSEGYGIREDDVGRGDLTPPLFSAGTDLNLVGAGPPAGPGCEEYNPSVSPLGEPPPFAQGRL